MKGIILMVDLNSSDIHINLVAAFGFGTYFWTFRPIEVSD